MAISPWKNWSGYVNFFTPFLIHYELSENQRKNSFIGLIKLLLGIELTSNISLYSTFYIQIMYFYFYGPIIWSRQNMIFHEDTTFDIITMFVFFRCSTWNLEICILNVNNLNITSECFTEFFGTLWDGMIDW